MHSSDVLDRPAPDRAVPPTAVAALPAAPSDEPDRDPVVRRSCAQLIVPVDASAASTRRLVWALQLAARRDAAVLAVGVVGADADDDLRAATRTLLDAQLLHAVGQTGIHDRARTALLDPAVLEALTGATGGADLVVVRPHRKTVLRPAVPGPPVRALRA